jgi:hypothetical protein
MYSKWSFTFGISSQYFYALLISLMNATCLSHLIFVYLIGLN